MSGMQENPDGKVRASETASEPIMFRRLSRAAVMRRSRARHGVGLISRPFMFESRKFV
jgi:hypothetical protein